MEAEIMGRKYCLSLVFYPQTDGGFTVVCPEIQGCVSEGETIEEAEKNVRELIVEFMPERIGHSNESREFFREGLGMSGKQFAEIEVEETDAGEIITAVEESAEALTKTA
jgi:predicted RNase H-like HicB family nuclease